MALKSRVISTPHFLAIIMASPMAQSCTAQSMFVRIFTTVSCPNSPHRTILGAESEISGFTRWKVSSSVPTSATIFPTFNICMPPVTGAATALAPRSSTRPLICIVFSKSVVECSIQTAPGCSPARIPSGPTSPFASMPIADETCSGLGSPVITTSHCSASSRQDSAHVAPCSKRSFATAGPLMSCNTGRSPARIKLPVTACPSCPMPIMPTRPGFGHSNGKTSVVVDAQRQPRRYSGGNRCCKGKRNRAPFITTNYLSL
mmetsp:Transcript_123894/g.246593  ORF Transcript_123894/g.246593 Transcript_123894/m.246593 type:complete len:260 (-) Transcript_123894:32-811(-)